uniref:RNA/RNP complex-1-interacting phosphatase n=1 Tax=Magallana gigas TaxID=29159 RepID=A0A8W8ILU0_MAGGI
MPPPDRWEKYQALGKVIPGTRLITFKVPLKTELCEKLPEDEQFTPKKLVAMVSELGHRLGMVVDLTFTKKYYAAFEFKGQGVRHEKIFTEGHNVPNDDVVYRFFDTLESFFKECQDENQVVGVHCTHGVNRTGYVVCRYMIERLGFNADKAMAVYHEARGYPIERENYIEDLRLRHLNLDYKYEGREKLPMQKHQQNRRPYQNREHRREGNEQEFHHNHRQHEEEYRERSRSHDIEHRREHHGQEYRNHRHNNRDRDYSAGFDLHRDMHHPQYPAKSYNRYGNQPWSQDQRDYHPPRGNHHWNSQSGDQQNRTRSAGRFQNFSDRRRFNNRADYDDDWRQSHIEIHDNNRGHDSEGCFNPKNQQPWTNSRSTFRQGYRNGYNDESREYYERNGRNRGQYQGDGLYRNQRSGPYGSRNNRPYHRHSENQSQRRSSGGHDIDSTK